MWLEEGIQSYLSYLLLLSPQLRDKLSEGTTGEKGEEGMRMLESGKH
jgi:hypothetical protein